MEQLLWFFRVHTGFDILSAIRTPFLIIVFLYQLDYVFLFFRYLIQTGKGGVPKMTLTKDTAPAALVVMPTLLRSKDELEGLKKAVMSAATNEYPGELYVIASIDDAAGNRAIFDELEAWMATVERPSNVHLFANAAPRRCGKAVAIDLAVHFLQAKIERGEVPAMPPIFFNMDGDSELGPLALARMVQRLLRKGFFSGERPMIVTSNVIIAPDVAWQGWRTYFSIKGQIALGVAREYLTSISIGKFNTRPIPVQEASGALYCTWSDLHEAAPKWAAFMQTIRFRDWLMWWLGSAPPRFLTSDVKALPEAQTGPGDDTWMTWLACCAHWDGDKVSLEFPRTPFHAFAQMIRAYFFRPLAYEPEARISTKTPTTIKALFKQRVRWNSSRVQDVGRWRPALMFHWRAALAVSATSIVIMYVHSMIVFSVLVWPFTHERSAGPMAFVLALTLNLIIRSYSTFLALIVDRRVKVGWRTLLAVPSSVPYHFMFNILPTIVGVSKDLFLFGVNTQFSPEETYIKSNLQRVALAYRCRRALALALRAIVHNDVPLGTFWFGWYETKWTPNGFTGWNKGKSLVLKPRLVPEAAPVIVPTFAPTFEPALRRSMIPTRVSMIPARPSMLPAMASLLPKAASIIPPQLHELGADIGAVLRQITEHPPAPSIVPGAF